MKIKVSEQAERVNIFTARAGFFADSLFYHCSYLLVYSSPELAHHWKNEIFSIVKPLKRTKLKSGSKYEALQEAFVEDSHGVHFCEDRDHLDAVLSSVYHNEEVPHEFDFDMGSKESQEVYIDALDKFYYEFLIPWVAKPDPDPNRGELNAAIDKYLIARRSELVPV